MLSARPKTTHADPNQQSRNRRKGKENFNENHPQCYQCNGLLQGVHRVGSPLPMKPPRSFKFRFKINGICRMPAHCVRARFRDRSRPCFIACALRRSCNFQASDRCRARKTVYLGARRITDCGQCASFRCKTVSTASVRKGAMTRRRASTATLFSLQNEECRVQSHFFSGRLAYGEGISERTLLARLINIVVVRRQEDVGLLRTDRPPLTMSGSSGLRTSSLRIRETF